MKVLPTRLSGLILIEPAVMRDERGFFVETYRRAAYQAVGVDTDFVQDNHSRSQVGTIRGLHYQTSPGQPKLVRVAGGAIWDVVVDIRRTSRTFGEWEAFDLDDVRLHQLFVPPGFAHGFCVVSDVADVVYKVGTYFDPSTERGIAWDDPDLAIPWPVASPQLSDRDHGQPLLRNLLNTSPTA
jgi:dTDP-4-dehydrorhamnose 3,5-epimerase